MSFSEVIEDGIKKIYSEDRATLEHYVDTVCTQVRNMDSAILYKAEAFFVPNDQYMLEMFGPSITNPEYEVYRPDGSCIWLHNLILPVTDVIGKPVGLAGFNPVRYLEAHETQDWGIYYYMYSNKSVFDKSKFLYSVPGTLGSALEDGYIVITDGIFDTLSLAAAGINAAALLGSYLSETVAAILRFFDKVILAMDNDEAGLQLYDRLNKVLDNVILLNQGWYKDADDVLKSGRREQYIAAIQNIISNCSLKSYTIGIRQTQIFD